MAEEQQLVNKVAKSGLITLDLVNYLPSADIVDFDLKDYLVQGVALMEKPFRESMKELDWSQFEGKHIALHCSADAIIPMWAYMLVTSYLQPYTDSIHYGDVDSAREKLFTDNIRQQINPSEYEGSKIVVKGCGDKTIPPTAYIEVTKLLQPVVKVLMYGEPCSTVPIYKKSSPTRKRTTNA